MKLALLVAIAFLILAAGTSTNYVLNIYQINRSQHQWCEVLTLLTADANPTTASGKEFYGKLTKLEREFGC